MAWNQPGNNGQDRDPWGSGKNSSGSNGVNKGNRSMGPVDLDDLFRKIGRKISGKNNDGNSNNKNHHYRLIILLVGILFVIWLGSGFYTIKETDLGVVTRFGKFSHIVQPGLNWKPTFIDHVRPVNVETTRELAASGVMLTADENVVQVEMNVQYRVTNPFDYLYSVTNPDNSLRQATDSALRAVIGKYSMDKILTEGRTIVRSDTQAELINTIKLYNLGITIQDVNFQAARPPVQVQAAFDDAIAARENEQQYIRQAEAYANEVQPKANGRAQRLLENAKAYKARVILVAQGEVARFNNLLPQYNQAPMIMRERMYLNTMQDILSHTRKIIIDDKGNNVMVLPLEQIMKGRGGQVNSPTVASSLSNKNVSAVSNATKNIQPATKNTNTHPTTTKQNTNDELSAVSNSNSDVANIYELRRNNARFGGGN